MQELLYGKESVAGSSATARKHKSLKKKREEKNVISDEAAFIHVGDVLLKATGLTITGQMKALLVAEKLTEANNVICSPPNIPFLHNLKLCILTLAMGLKVLFPTYVLADNEYLNVSQVI